MRLALRRSGTHLGRRKGQAMDSATAAAGVRRRDREKFLNRTSAPGLSRLPDQFSSRPWNRPQLLGR